MEEVADQIQQLSGCYLRQRAANSSTSNYPFLLCCAITKTIALCFVPNSSLLQFRNSRKTVQLCTLVVIASSEQAILYAIDLHILFIRLDLTRHHFFLYSCYIYSSHDCSTYSSSFRRARLADRSSTISPFVCIG